MKPLDDPSWKRAFILSLSVAFVLHLLASIFSVGFYHTDEHFQILEFLAYKLGMSSGSDLAIEFGQKLRPWFQPGLDYVLVQVMKGVGITSPFHWAFAFRFISAFLGWLSLVGLSLLSYSWFEDPRLKKLALLLVSTLWYLPALHARHSSESLSGSVFYIAGSLLFLFCNSERRLFFLGIGLLFGAAFLFRYQVAFLILGALGYYAIRYRPRFSKLAALATGIALMTGLGVLIDHWGYGAWTFTPWNYFHYNIVLNHVADVDTQPVWDFFRSTLTETFPPLGFLALCSFVLGWIFRPLHMLTWITFPLYLIHSIIGHKELRFIFPVAEAGPFLVFLALTAQHKGGEVWRKIWWSKPGQLTAQALFALNLIALVPTTLLPCWMPARLFSQIYEIKKTRSPDRPMEILYKDKDPFEILGIPLNFYRPPDTHSKKITSFPELYAQIDSANASGSGPVWFFQVGFELPEEAAAARRHCALVAESLPPGLSALIRSRALQPFTRRVTDWTLYRCQ